MASRKEQKYLYSKIFYGGQKLHKYFSSLRVRGTSLFTCWYIGELRNGQKEMEKRVRQKSCAVVDRGAITGQSYPSRILYVQSFFIPWRLLRAKRVKPSQRHSTLRGMAAHHALRTLNPNASHLQVTTASLAKYTQLQQHHSELAADRASALAAD